MIGWATLIAIWIIAGIAGAASECSCQTDQLSSDACGAEAGIGVMLILFLGRMVEGLLAIVAFASRPSLRQCPRCGSKVKTGFTECWSCGFDGATIGQPNVPEPPESRGSSAPNRNAQCSRTHASSRVVVIEGVTSRASVKTTLSVEPESAENPEMTKKAKANPVAVELRELGVKGILVRIAELGQLRELRCEMPQCYNHKGRKSFDAAKTKPNSWAPSADHYPILKAAGGKLTPGNVRLAHVRCNHLDHVRRTQIRMRLDKGESLAEIAEHLNQKKIPPAHGSNRWTPAMVRKAFAA